MTRWLIRSLAVWRLTRMLMKEQGPYDVFETLRFVAKDTTWGDMLKCRYCTSVWAAFFILLLPLKLIEGLALSQLSLMWANWWGSDV